ncbi:unnamed protein product, partial [Protopolystoma xenopodis]
MVHRHLRLPEFWARTVASRGASALAVHFGDRPAWTFGRIDAYANRV